VNRQGLNCLLFWNAPAAVSPQLNVVNLPIDERVAACQ
jgi:hypothetical protein